MMFIEEIAGVLAIVLTVWTIAFGIFRYFKKDDSRGSA
jgi:hypothetical protein